MTCPQRLKCYNCLDDKSGCELIELRCKHRYCLICMKNDVLNNLSNNIINIKCMMSDCQELVPDDEIKNVISDEEIKKFESLRFMELYPTYFSCLLPECKFMSVYERRICQHKCPNCTLYNCISCKASHEDLECNQYKNMSKTESEKICKKAMDSARKHLHEKELKLNLEESKKSLRLNKEVFQCDFCGICIGKNVGIQLYNCCHLICRPCLIEQINQSENSYAKCPTCDSAIQDREIKAILTDEAYEHYDKKRTNCIKALVVNIFHCQTHNCGFFCELVDTRVKVVKCHKCNSQNCVACVAIHENEKCKDYKRRLQSTEIGRLISGMNKEISIGYYMKCPGCRAVVQNPGTCPSVTCPVCNMSFVFKNADNASTSV